tara:strand:- start:2155 stop:3690 length:1536 start_codon:yes stop_codon:yes gene_type:complete
MKKFNFYFDYFLTKSDKIVSQLGDERVLPLPNAMPPEFYISLINKIPREVNDFYHGYWMNPMIGGDIRLIEYFKVSKINFEIKNIQDKVNKNEYNWYVIEITDVRSITVASPLTNIPKNTIKFIKENDLKILLWCQTQDIIYYKDNSKWDNIFKMNSPLIESESDIFRLYSIYEFLRFYDIKFENLYLRHHSLNYSEIIEKLSLVYPQIENLSQMNILPTNGCLWEYRFYLHKEKNQPMFSHLKENRKILDESNLLKTRKKWFMSLNGIVKPHRVRLLAELKSRNILDKGYCSLVGLSFEYNFQKNGNLLNYNLNKKEEIIYLIDHHMGGYHWALDHNLVEETKTIIENIPMLVDGYTFHNNDKALPVKNILDSYFSIITETQFKPVYDMGNEVIDKDRFFYSLLITEKTCKPLYYMHPFIVLGSPGILEYLRSIGFETFPEFFDESYDEIYDSEKRFMFCIREIEKLCNKDLKEVHELYQSIIPKLKHNKEMIEQYDFKKELERWFSYEN